MRYYLRDPNDQAITGPFELDEIEAKLKAGELSAGTLATGDIGEGLARIRHAPPEDWFPAESIRGLGEERQPNAEVLPPGPPPLPLQNPVSPTRIHASGMAFCPACGHKLAPDVGRVCDRCGKELFPITPVPDQAPLPDPDKYLPLKAAAVAGGGFLSVVMAILAILGVLFLIGFFLFLNLMSNCKA